MPQNQWESPETGPPTRQWVPTPPPQQSPEYRSSTRGGGGGVGVVIAVVAAVLSVALLLGVIWWVFLRDDGGDKTASQAPTFAASATATETVGPGSAEGSEESSVDTDAALPSPSVSPLSPHRTSTLPSGLDSRGWTSYRDASCNSSDSWVYAGGNSTTKVVVCRVGRKGDLYYRGMRNGSGLERDVDMSTADVDAGYFRIPAKPATIIINGDELIVYGSDGSVSVRESFAGQAWKGME